MTARKEINATVNSSLTGFSSFDLVKLINEVIADNHKKYFNASGMGVEITFSVENHLFAFGIKKHIAAAFRSILENSVETISGNGKIVIKLEKFDSSALLSIYNKSYMEKINMQASEDASSSIGITCNKDLDNARDIIAFHGGTIKSINTSDGANILIVTIPAFLKKERIKATRIRNHLKGTQILVAAPDSLLKDSIITALEAKKALISRCASYKEFNIMASSQFFTIIIADDSFLKENKDQNIISSIKKAISLIITDNPEHYASIAKLCLSIPINIELLISKLNALFSENISKKQRGIKRN